MQLELEGKELDEAGYIVDGEYSNLWNENSEENDPKKIKIEGKEKRIYPDIIIHRRGVPKENLMIIEMKINKTSSYDYKKIRNAIKQLNYKVGYFLKFTKDACSFKEFLADGSESNLKSIDELLIKDIEVK